MSATEPMPPVGAPPRYGVGPLPGYRYIPGRSPHPRRDPRGHSWAQPEPRAVAMDPGAWSACALYLRGVDLFNQAYFWESHEAFEALWRASPPGSPTAELLQALIQIAAAEIKRFSALPAPAGKLVERALARLAAVPSPWLGLDVRAIEREVRERASGARAEQPLLILSG